MQLVIVRGFGYDVTHCIEVAESMIGDFYWPSPEYPFRGVKTPLVALCGARPKSVQPFMAIMDAERTTSCVPCRILKDLAEDDL